MELAKFKVLLFHRNVRKIYNSDEQKASMFIFKLFKVHSLTFVTISNDQIHKKETKKKRLHARIG